MNLRQSFKIAFKSILAKKGRSVLTMLGIIIGLAAVIIMVSFAQGQNKWTEEYYASLGDNTINIMAFRYDGVNVTEKLYTYCQGLSDYLVGVSPNDTVGSTVIKYGTKTVDANTADWDKQLQVTLGNQQYSLCAGYTLAGGRDLTYLDIQNLNQVCVLGAAAASQIFDYANPVGEVIYINGNPITVVGVFEATTTNQDMNFRDRVVLMPYTLRRLFASSGVQSGSFVAKAKDSASITQAISRLNGYLPGLVGDSGYGYAESPSKWQDQAQDENRMQQLFLGGIAAISLLVGGIGIMNIMLVTVTERTREIGIRKAIGAERKSIIAQFLIEACLICGIGGIIGIAIGYLGTLIVCQVVLGFIMIPAPGIIAISFVFSVGMGIIFGSYPAVKASGLQPVVALRAD